MRLEDCQNIKPGTRIAFDGGLATVTKTERYGSTDQHFISFQMDSGVVHRRNVFFVYNQIEVIIPKTAEKVDDYPLTVFDLVEDEIYEAQGMGTLIYKRCGNTLLVNTAKEDGDWKPSTSSMNSKFKKLPKKKIISGVVYLMNDGSFCAESDTTHLVGGTYTACKPFSFEVLQ